MTAPTARPTSYAAGVRLPFHRLPEQVRAWVGQQLAAPIRVAADQQGGFSPGVAAVVTAENGATAFVKAVGGKVNPDSIGILQREREKARQLPALPGLLRPTTGADLMVDDEPWTVTLFPALDGHPPAHPWGGDDAVRVLDRLLVLGKQLTPSPLPDDPAAQARLETFFSGWRTMVQDPTDPWWQDAWAGSRIRRFADLEAGLTARLSGKTLVHFDLRSDNILLTADEVWFIDWAHPRNAAGWVDPVLLFFDMVASGADIADGGTLDLNSLLTTHPAFAAASAEDRWFLLIALAGALHTQSRRPAPPGLPTIRAWQDLTSETAMRFLRRHAIL